MNKLADQILTKMFEELEKAPLIYRPSAFWIALNKIHLKHLNNSGFNNFKRSIAGKYFSWGILGIVYHQFGTVLNEVLRFNFMPFTRSNFKGSNLDLGRNVRKFNVFTSHIYRIYVASLFDFISTIDNLQLFEKIKEPSLGNPFLINYKNLLISQDVCNSIHEFYTLSSAIKFPKKIKIAELGAGYGRLAFIFLKVLPDSSYCIIDIPPALYISQKYLSTIFYKEKIFKFRPFKSYKDIKREFEVARIKFLMPHQIKLLPKKQFDLFITISSLHEMTRPQIINYTNQADRLTQGYFYTKQWRKSRTKDNFCIKQIEYPIPEKWEVIMNRNRHPIQKMFFDALYKIP